MSVPPKDFTEQEVVRDLSQRGIGLEQAQKVIVLEGRMKRGIRILGRIDYLVNYKGWRLLFR
jgi:ribosome-interacting GTPase 1